MKSRPRLGLGTCSMIRNVEFTLLGIISHLFLQESKRVHSIEIGKMLQSNNRPNISPETINKASCVIMKIRCGRIA
jgi:hypothetical protein